MTSCLHDILQRLPSMTPVEKRIAETILDNPSAMIDETITHLAARSGTSAGSIANFAVSMGYRGFTDLKLSIARSLEKQPSSSFDGVSSADDPRQAMSKLIASAAAAFQDTLEQIGDGLAQAAKLLNDAKRIEIYAGGSSLPIGYDAHYRLLRLGLPVVFIPDPILSCMSAAQTNEHTVVLAISHKGRTTGTLTAVNTAQSRGAKVIALTSFRLSPLAEQSNVCLLSASNEVQQDREAVISRLTQLMIIDSLCAYLAAQRGEEAIKYLDREIEVLEHYRQ